MKITALVALLLVGIACAKPKGGAEPNPNIVNPDTDEGAAQPKNSPEYNEGECFSMCIAMATSALMRLLRK